MSLPEVTTSTAWRAARLALLAEEKAMTRARDALSAKRRELPMVEVEKDYRFEGPGGSVTLRDLFEGRRQVVAPERLLPQADTKSGCAACAASARPDGRSQSS